MPDFIRPLPRPQRTNLQVVQRAISAGAHDAAVVVPPPPAPGSLTQDVVGVNDANDFLEVDDANDTVVAGS